MFNMEKRYRNKIIIIIIKPAHKRAKKRRSEVTNKYLGTIKLQNDPAAIALIARSTRCAWT